MADTQQGATNNVSWFVPLRHAAGLPQGHRHSVDVLLPFTFPEYRAWADDDDHDHDEDRPLAPKVYLSLHLTFHRMDVGPERMAADGIALMDFVSSTILGEGSLPARQAPGPPPEGMQWFESVVEMSLDLPEPEPESLNDLFDTALSFLSDVIRAMALITQGWDVLPTRALLPGFVPMVRRTGSEVALEAFGVNQTFITRFVPPRELTAEEAGFIAHSANMATNGHPVMAYDDLRREWRAQLWAFGNRRAAATFLYTSGEVFLNNLLTFMLWEESRSPNWAAREVFHRKYLATRLRVHYHDRLGGIWHDGPVQRWLGTTARLRHSVVHAGYEPTSDDIQAARDAEAELRKFVGSRLTTPAVMKRFPRTVTTVLGPNSIPASALKDRLEAFSNSPDEPPWVLRFDRWKWFFNETMLSLEGVPAPEHASDQAGVVAIVYPEGIASWCEHNPITRRARRCAVPDPLPFPFDLPAFRREAPPQTVWPVSVAAPVAPTETYGNWVREDFLIPGKEIFHYRSQELPPTL